MKWNPSILLIVQPVVQVRLFPYGDTQRYRLGINFPQLPINRPFYSYNPTRRDGANNIINLGNLPNYFPNYNGPQIVQPAQYRQTAEQHMRWIGNVTNFQSQITDSDFDQPRDYWNQLADMGPDQQGNFIYNVASSLSGANKGVRQETYGMLKPPFDN
jgi:catalase